jgi:hypothetical protein
MLRGHDAPSASWGLAGRWPGRASNSPSRRSNATGSAARERDGLESLDVNGELDASGGKQLDKRSAPSSAEGR